MAEARYLLDTHSLIWFQDNNPKIPERVMKLIQDTNNSVYFSQVSLFEIAIKLKIAKLPAFRTTVEKVYQQAINDGFTFLSVQNSHIYIYDEVPLLDNHRDPFDRLLIATAKSENMVILSVDEKFSFYNDLIEVFW